MPNIRSDDLIAQERQNLGERIDHGLEHMVEMYERMRQPYLPQAERFTPDEKEKLRQEIIEHLRASA